MVAYVKPTIGFTIPQKQKREGLKPKVSRNKGPLILSLIGAIILTASPIIFADGNLTDLFQTKGFQGSWSVISKFGWLGYIMQFIISFFSLLGLFLIMYEKMLTLLYLSSKNLWNNVYEVKESVKGAGFGLPGMAKRVYTGEDGTGLDAFISFGYGLLPNVRKYSAYGMEGGKLDKDEDNALKYILKTGPETVCLILFLSLGYSGTLGQIYAVFVDGAVAVMDNIVAIQLEDYVDRIFASGSDYRFTIDAEGTPESRLQQNTAKRAYREIIGKGDVTDPDQKFAIGQYVEKNVKDNLKAAKVAEFLGKDKMVTEEDWRAVDVRVTLSTLSDDPTAGFKFEVPKDVFNSGAYIKVHYQGQRTYGDYFNVEK